MRTICESLFKPNSSFAGSTPCSSPGDKQFEAMFENAMHQDLHRLLLKRLNEVDTQGFSQEKLKATALVISWAYSDRTLPKMTRTCTLIRLDGCLV